MYLVILLTFFLKDRMNPIIPERIDVIWHINVRLHKIVNRFFFVTINSLCFQTVV